MTDKHLPWIFKSELSEPNIDAVRIYNAKKFQDQQVNKSTSMSSLLWGYTS